MQETRPGDAPGREDPQRPYARLLEPLAHGQKVLRRAGGPEAARASLRLTVCQKLWSKNVAAVVLAVPGMDVLALPQGRTLLLATDPAPLPFALPRLLVHPGRGLALREGLVSLGVGLLDRLGERTLGRLVGEPPGAQFLEGCPEPLAVDLVQAWSRGLLAGLPVVEAELGPKVGTALARLWRQRDRGLAELDPQAAEYLAAAGRIRRVEGRWRLEDEDMAQGDRRTQDPGAHGGYGPILRG